MIKSRGLGRACNKHGEKRNAYRILMGNSGEKRPLERSKYNWENNIKMNLKSYKIFCYETDGLGWGPGAQWRTVVNIVMNFQFP